MFTSISPILQSCYLYVGPRLGVASTLNICLNSGHAKARPYVPNGAFAGTINKSKWLESVL